MVLKNNCIIEVGTHEELRAKSTHYNELMVAQDLILAST